MILLAAPSAMELDPLRSLLARRGFCQVGETIPVIHGSLTIMQKDGERALSLLECGTGKVRSALSTLEASSILKERGLHLQGAMLLGIAGAAGSAKIGDINLARESLQWDLDTRPFAGTPGLYPDGSGLIPIRNPLRSHIGRFLSGSGISFFEGRAYTGDTFLRGRRPEAVTGEGSVDMESYSFLDAVHHSCKDALVVRLVSDTATERPREGISSFVKRMLGPLWDAILPGALTFTHSGDIVTERNSPQETGKQRFSG